MPTLRLPQPLRVYTDGENVLTLQGATVKEMLDDMVRRYPALQPHL